MNIIRKRVFSNYQTAHITYGSVTTPKRKELGVEQAKVGLMSKRLMESILPYPIKAINKSILV